MVKLGIRVMTVNAKHSTTNTFRSMSSRSACILWKGQMRFVFLHPVIRPKIYNCHLCPYSLHFQNATWPDLACVRKENKTIVFLTAIALWPSSSAYWRAVFPFYIIIHINVHIPQHTDPKLIAPHSVACLRTRLISPPHLVLKAGVSPEV